MTVRVECGSSAFRVAYWTIFWVKKPISLEFCWSSLIWYVPSKTVSHEQTNKDRSSFNIHNKAEVFTCTSLVNAYVIAGELLEARSRLEEMRNRGISPNECLAKIGMFHMCWDFPLVPCWEDHQWLPYCRGLYADYKGFPINVGMTIPDTRELIDPIRAMFKCQSWFSSLIYRRICPSPPRGLLIHFWSPLAIERMNIKWSTNSRRLQRMLMLKGSRVVVFWSFWYDCHSQRMFFFFLRCHMLISSWKGRDEAIKSWPCQAHQAEPFTATAVIRCSLALGCSPKAG